MVNIQMVFQRRKYLQPVFAAAALYILLTIPLTSGPKEQKNANSNICALRATEEPPKGILPVFAAAYPGSGSKMTWNLIEALTGYWSGDDWFINGRNETVVSIKTHYPHPEGRVPPLSMRIQRALIIIRHPMDAIPSYHNYLYEVENNAGEHSVRAPIDAWIQWRDANFGREITMWKESIIYWMNSYPPGNRMVMFYEEITDIVKGPLEAYKLSEFLAETETLESIGEKRADCIWHAIVNYGSNTVATTETDGDDEEISRRKLGLRNDERESANIKALRPHSAHQQQHVHMNPNSVKRFLQYKPAPESRRSGGPKYKPYTKYQLDHILEVLRELQGTFHESEVVVMFETYIARVLQSEVSE